MRTHIAWLGVALAAGSCAFAAVWLSSQSTIASTGDVRDRIEEHTTDGNYRRLCLPCHGTAGEGDGPAAPWLWPRPRDFTAGQYKWRSTDVGEAPAPDDIERTIRYGVPGTSMHGFETVLSEAEISGLAKRLIEFAPEKSITAPQLIPIGEPPTIDAALIERGKTAYVELGCDKCHGASGKGDGPAAATLKNADGTPSEVYDLTAQAFRRPRSLEENSTIAIAKSLATGLTGTPMPSFRDAAPGETLWAIAAYVNSIAAELKPETNRSTVIHNLAASDDSTRAGHWHGTPADPDAIVWGRPIAAMGKPPSVLAPAQASLSVNQCARCHAAQFRDWSQTVHAAAMSPGIMAQIVEVEHDPDQGKYVESCVRCHAPLAEQQALIAPDRTLETVTSPAYKPNPSFDTGLQAEAISCAGCHVREWQRHGPPDRGTSTLIPSEPYPLRRTDFYERSDFCLACHQLSPGNRLGDRPLLNTYVEWLASPYFTRGIQCQHCHMPNREHTWKGVHDPQTFRQGIRVSAASEKADGTLSVSVSVENVGAGHYLPTTPTPAAFVDIELLDTAGRPIAGAKKTGRIGRYIRYDDQWVEVEDTRIPPGESFDLDASFEGDAAAAAEVLVTVRVEPDEYYERLYRGELARDLPARQLGLYREALTRAEASHFIALTKRFRVTAGE